MDKQNLLLIVTLLLGFMLGIPSSFIASIWYDRAKQGRSQKAARLKKRDELWKTYLSSESGDERTKAFQELTVVVLRYFILGNVFFGISGLTWLFEFVEMHPFSNGLAALTSLAAIIYFARALAWMRLYFKYSDTIQNQVDRQIVQQ